MGDPIWIPVNMKNYLIFGIIEVTLSKTVVLWIGVEKNLLTNINLDHGLMPVEISAKLRAH